MAEPRDRYLALTCFKNEAPFILEWLAYHRAIGFDDFLIYTNDCDDETVPMLDRLSQLGLVTHRDNTQKPGQRNGHQARAFLKAVKDPMYLQARWCAIIDADEFVNIHVGDGQIRDLTQTAEGADAISLTWRVFGTAGHITYAPDFVTRQFKRAARHFSPRPAQAWGMKTVFQTRAFERLGAHRPRIPTGGDWSSIRWVDGNNRVMPSEFHTDNWRHNRETYGYDLGQVNHYAVRSHHSFLMKQLRGRVFGGREMDLTYWTWMNRNEEADTTITRHQRAMKREFNQLMRDDRLAELQASAIATHQSQIAQVLETHDARLSLEKMAEIEALGPQAKEAIDV